MPAIPAKVVQETPPSIVLAMPLVLAAYTVKGVAGSKAKPIIYALLESPPSRVPFTQLSPPSVLVYSPP